MSNRIKKITMSQQILEILNRLEEMVMAISNDIQDLKEKKSNETFLDNDDLTRILKVSKRSLSTWRKSNLLPHSMIGNKIFYAYSDVEKLILNKKIQKK
jgi:hypothetical protein